MWLRNANKWHTGMMGWLKSMRAATGVAVASGTLRATGCGTVATQFLMASTRGMVSEGRLWSGGAAPERGAGQGTCGGEDSWCWESGRRDLSQHSERRFA
jgi:hypothetical protein